MKMIKMLKTSLALLVPVLTILAMALVGCSSNSDGGGGSSGGSGSNGGSTPSPETMVETIPASFTLPAGGIKFPTDIHDGGSATIKHKFALSKTEVTYELWHKVKTWATDSARGANKYTFVNAGKEGHDGTAGAAPTAAKNEPVTHVSWRDAIVWSNAYTEWSNATKGTSYTVVYYTDGAYTTPLRTSTNATVPNPLSGATAGSEDKPYIKASSNGNTDMANNLATGFRLPTKTEWEFAARLRKDNTNCVAISSTNTTCKSVSIGSTAYYFTKGNSTSGATKPIGVTGLTLPTGQTWEGLRDEATRVAVYTKWYNGSSWVDQIPVTSSTANVATKDHNALGLHDMSGNVWELCFDILGGSSRVIRGGGWSHDAGVLQVGDVSSGVSPNGAVSYLGFRLARSLP